MENPFFFPREPICMYLLTEEVGYMLSQVLHLFLYF